MRPVDLKLLADEAMRLRDLDPGYSREALQQVERAQAHLDASQKDLRELAWCSIDNGEGDEVTSKDLDQISFALELPHGKARVYVAIADVDSLVPLGSPVDLQARKNTATVYTADKRYPMLDPRFSEDLTSLNEGEDRMAIVTEMVITADGEVEHDVRYRARVRNQVKLNYESTGAWLEGPSEKPLSRAGIEVMASIRLQDRVAQAIKELRRRNGSLELESREAEIRMLEGRVVEIRGHLLNRATELIENLMVACNGCASRFLKASGFPVFERIVRVPKYWERIVELAATKGAKLPRAADSKALEVFLERQRAHDPLRFPDLCLSVLKLLGRGEYVVEAPGEAPIGHFGLAVREYSHSTAPNRRYPDLITQRLLKAALANKPCPYRVNDLVELAQHCSTQESQIQKVERQIEKSAAALMLSEHIGESFSGVVSGATQRGTWVRLLDVPIEGKLLGMADLGDRVRVKLTSVNVEKGFIDFHLESL